MRVLMVSPYPPMRDGIAAYAVQTVAALRAEGHDVEVLSPGPSAAHHHLDLVGPRGGLALAKRVRGYDRVVVQFHPDFFYPVPTTAKDRAAVSVAYAGAFRVARAVEVVVHEVDYRTGRGPAGWATRLLWRAVDRIVVHTETERGAFVRAFGVRRDRVALAEHGADFVRRTGADRATARRSLGVEPDAFTFLCIGFIQPHKGFDRAVRAFTGLGAKGCRIDVVGSVRVEDTGFLAYLDELRALVGATDGAHLHDGFVSDELFDRWIVASDVVVLPYRSIWSSSVLERAALYGTPVIATAVGGLPQQARERGDITLVSGDADLRAALWAAAGQRAGAVVSQPWPEPEPGPELRARVQAEVQLRAAQARGSRVVAGTAPGTARRGEGGAAVAAASAVSAPLRRISPAQLPAPLSNRASAARVKRAVRRLTAWELEPLVGHVNALRAATIEAVERLAAVPPGRTTTPAATDRAEAGSGGPQRYPRGP